jgi:hypothetical protein
MSLDLKKHLGYADPYNTNWDYLQNMSSLQVKALEEMNWYWRSKEIDTSLLQLPYAWFYREDAKASVKRFRYSLNNKIRGL